MGIKSAIVHLFGGKTDKEVNDYVNNYLTRKTQLQITQRPIRKLTAKSRQPGCIAEDLRRLMGEEQARQMVERELAAKIVEEMLGGWIDFRTETLPDGAEETTATAYVSAPPDYQEKEGDV